MIGCSVLGAHAQQRRVETAVRYDSINVDYRTRYTSSFGDNFYIQGSLAGRVLCAEEDAKMDFGDRLQPGFQLAVGKKLFPSFGVRLSGGGMRLQGWNTGKPGIYKGYANWLGDGVDPLKEYYKQQGIPTDDGYKQQIKYYEVNADFVVDLYNAFHKQKRFNRRWDYEAFVGVGFLHMCRWRGMTANNKVSFRLGGMVTYNLTSRLGVNVELAGATTDATFDGEIGKNRWFDSYVSGLVGLRWRVGRQGYKVVRLISQEQYTALNNSISKIRREVEDISMPLVNTMEQGRRIGLLVPSVVFYKGQVEYNEELQLVNIFKIARFMDEHKGRKVVVVGNTSGTDVSLARKRAEFVRDVLVNRYSIEPSRLSIRVQNVNEAFNVIGYDQAVNFSIAE